MSSKEVSPRDDKESRIDTDPAISQSERKEYSELREAIDSAFMSVRRANPANPRDSLQQMKGVLMVLRRVKGNAELSTEEVNELLEYAQSRAGELGYNMRF